MHEYPCMDIDAWISGQSDYQPAKKPATLQPLTSLPSRLSIYLFLPPTPTQTLIFHAPTPQNPCEKYPDKKVGTNSWEPTHQEPTMQKSFKYEPAHQNSSPSTNLPNQTRNQPNKKPTTNPLPRTNGELWTRNGSMVFGLRGMSWIDWIHKLKWNSKIKRMRWLNE